MLIRGTHGVARPKGHWTKGKPRKIGSVGNKVLNAIAGDPPNIKINIAINRAEAAKLDAIRALILQ